LKSLERVQQATKQKSKFGELVSSMDTETNPDVLVVVKRFVLFDCGSSGEMCGAVKYCDQLH
jgi:hypothetical protein